MRRHKYATQRASKIPNDPIDSNTEHLSSPIDDSDLDMEWRKGSLDSSRKEEDTSDSDLDMECDEANKDDLYYSDEDGHIGCKRAQCSKKEVDPNSEMPVSEVEPIYRNGKIMLRLWKKFRDHKHFWDVLKDFAIQEGFELRKVKHARTRVTSTCRAEGCSWRIHASLSPDKRKFIIKTYNPEHKCQCVVKNRIATSGWIAKKLLKSFARTPDLSLQKMRDELKDNFGIEATNKQLWKARQKARGDVGGGYVQSYANLRRYAVMVHNTNPRSSTIVQSQLVSIMSEEEGTMQPQFKRIFICYEGFKSGFLAGCRPFFGLDGCHLKGPYKVIFFVAVEVDANLHFYPLAYAIVEAENTESWRWILKQLIREIGETTNGQPWCIMSDRQKGLIEAVAAIPNAEHHYCCFHVENNMIKKFGTSQLRGMFWAALETANFDNFKHIMVMIKQFNMEAHEWLSNIDFGHWTLSKFDTRTKVEHLTNNFVVSFNDWIEEHRYKPPIELLEGLRIKHAEMLCTRKDVDERWEQKLTPRVHLKVNELLKKSRLAHVTRVGQEEF
ncbi:uncharacterized protein LOC133792440 [Humulus lupulus]|uniref:uncharacterized protein LOC133792440 n=1 Tax=Humulus lupulus TaxID=3486 RepID=UPI002B403C84|nr:uncharacterized protein LOC133792440 [Humulus lupulus]